MFINVPGHPQAPRGPNQVGERQQRIEASFLDETNQCCHWSKTKVFYFQAFQTLIENI